MHQVLPSLYEGALEITLTVPLIHVCLVPPITWIPKYDFKKNIAADLVAGFTVAIMHIPQVIRSRDFFMQLGLSNDRVKDDKNYLNEISCC